MCTKARDLFAQEWVSEAKRISQIGCPAAKARAYAEFNIWVREEMDKLQALEGLEDNACELELMYRGFHV